MISLDDESFSSYADYLRENRDAIRELLFLSEDSAVRKAYDAVFQDNFISMDQGSPTRLRIAATDSSEFIRELYNGRKLILSRAFTKSADTLKSTFFSRVMSVDREDMNTFMVMLMENLEHLSAIDFLENAESDAILLDGSVTGRFNHRVLTLRAEGFENFHEEYFNVISNLIRTSVEKKVPILFVAKSSETTIFRRHLSSLIGRNVDSDRRVTDHLLVKSLARNPGYTRPVKSSYTIPLTGEKATVSTFHIVPDQSDVPLKVDYVHTSGQADEDVPEVIINMLFYGYAGYKVYNLWLSDVDNSVKFRKEEVERIFMKEFERQIGIQFYETRGERRARIRI